MFAFRVRWHLVFFFKVRGLYQPQELTTQNSWNSTNFSLFLGGREGFPSPPPPQLLIPSDNLSTDEEEREGKEERGEAPICMGQKQRGPLPPYL